MSKKAIEAPASFFDTPEEVLEDAELTTAQKIEALRRWEYEAWSTPPVRPSNTGCPDRRSTVTSY